MAELPQAEARSYGFSRRVSLDRAAVLFTLLLLALAFVVLYPILLLLIRSFQEGAFGQATTWGLGNWTNALSEPKFRTSIVNTLTLTATRQLIAFVIGVGLAWLIARTNLPGRNWLEFGFWVALFLPPLPVLLGWILLFDQRTGLMNSLVEMLPFVENGPFNIYSWWGIIFAHVASGTLATKVFLLTPAFRNMDASLEEASRTSGSSVLGTVVRIVVPIMLPAIMAVMLLGTIRSMQAFEVELILGTPINLDVYSTLIYRQVSQEPPQFGTATALAMLILLILLPFIFLQQWFGRRRSHATITGKYSARLQDLGRWRWPLFGLILAGVLFMTALPLAMLLLSSFMRLFGNFNLPQVWTLAHWERNITHPWLVDSLRNTVLLGGLAAVIGMAVYSIIAYVAIRTRFYGRGVLDFLTWMPATIPGIVISLGFLWLILGTPIFRPLYGTIWVLVLAVLLGNITVGSQVIKTSMQQLGMELEEASWTAGASWFYTLRRVVFPLIAPTLAVVGLQVFAFSVAQVSLVALLGSPSNRPLSLLQLNFLENGRFEAAAVTGVLIFAITMVAALAARIVGLRLGVGRQAR